MKRIFLFVFIITSVVSKGQDPKGMVLIPEGSFEMGGGSSVKSVKGTKSVAAFYMDEAEVSNSKYRDFVNWVKDSIIRTELAKAIEETGPDDRVNRYAFMPKYPGEATKPIEEMDDEDKKLNWRYELVWDDIKAYDRDKWIVCFSHLKNL